MAFTRDPGAFFGVLRNDRMLGPDLSQSEVNGLNAITTAAAGWPIAWTAYLLGTAYKETAHTMLPIAEYGGDAYFFRRYDMHGNNPPLAQRLGNTQPGDGARFKGRGYVQLTGRANYARASRELGHDFVARPDDAMIPLWAAKIARLGMAEGWFTSKRLGDYLPHGIGAFSQFSQARRIINGMDCAAEIAGYAATFQRALQAGGWA